MFLARKGKGSSLNFPDMNPLLTSTPEDSSSLFWQAKVTEALNIGKPNASRRSLGATGAAWGLCIPKKQPARAQDFQPLNP